MHPDEPYYCSEQIPIHPELPDILKQYTKAAIRTQPSDLLAWSAKYFRCLADGQTPPVKDRLELPIATQKTDSGLTIGLIKTLHKQMIQKDVKKSLDINFIKDRWKGLNLPIEKFDMIIHLGNLSNEINWHRFMPLACSTISKDLTDTLTKVCEVLTSDPPGANARIRFDVFKDIYLYLITQIDKTTSRKYAEDVCAYLESEWAKRQDGMIHPRNFTHAECPKLTQ